ncbi:MAG: Mrp/NBP35 family ATP-binding protein [Rhodothermia bacterium]|nr:MAG: Mrp/NBP35 family ATP-binding protein [Rhodothermia bacterium]
MQSDLDQIIESLSKIVEPESGKDVVRLGLIRNLQISEKDIQYTIVLKDPSSPFASQVEELSLSAIRDIVGEKVSIHIEMDNEMIELGDGLVADQAGKKTPGKCVLNTIAVASGKGGVGKSTVSVNLAIALAREGYDVGLVDADIYGPSIPTMFGLEEARPKINESQQIIPLEKFGVKVLSIGFLVDQDKAVIWRGPLVSSATKQFLGETDWGDLDFLILDLPPGTGDIQLTIVQTVALTGAIVVSTPQKVALADARKGVAMFEQVGVPVLGLVENMAYFTPPDLPDRKYFLFGEGGARELAEKLDIPVLAELPLDEALRISCDVGQPLAASGDGYPSFQEMARVVAHQVAIRNITKPDTEKIELATR